MKVAHYVRVNADKVVTVNPLMLDHDKSLTSFIFFSVRDPAFGLTFCHNFPAALREYS